MKQVLIIQNDPVESLGLYEVFLRDKVEVKLFKAYELSVDDGFPPVSDYDAFMIGPTPISANNAHKHPFLRKELRTLNEIWETGKPCIGVCCGGQMLALVQGGEVKPSPVKEVGGYTVKLTEEGAMDPLFHGFPNEFPVFQWHNDMFTVPPRGKLLVSGTPCPVQSFRKDNVWGILFHLEITKENVLHWVKEYPEEPQSMGKSTDIVINECAKNEKTMTKLAQRLIDNFLSQI